MKHAKAFTWTVNINVKKISVFEVSDERAINVRGAQGLKVDSVSHTINRAIRAHIPAAVSSAASMLLAIDITNEGVNQPCYCRLTA